MSIKSKPAPGPTTGKQILCVDDFEALATQKLPTLIRHFYNDGATEQVTVGENRTAYRKYRIRPRVLRDVSNPDTSTTCFGTRVAFPLGISPAGIQAMAHPDGELGVSRACARKGVAMAISSFANFAVADIVSASQNVRASSGLFAVQMYTLKNREWARRMLREAEANGCRAVLLTADSPVLGVRYYETRADFRTPGGLQFPNLGWDAERVQSQRHDDGFENFSDEGQNWEREIPWLRDQTKMEIWIKGVLTAEDTLKAVEMGCDGILVSNHGGRQLDGVPATLDALPECVAAAAGRIRVHIDGGIRTGVDIFKALALGAEHVWVGRPALWALATDGEKGVNHLLDILHAEFKRCMQLAGCRQLQDITKDRLGVVRSDGPLARL